MLKIKLARFGKRGQPHFRIVVNEAKSKRDGQYVAKIGEYAPTHQPKILTVDLKAYEAWLAKGAQPTDTVAALVERSKSKDPFPAKKPRPSKKARAKLAAAAEEKTAAKATPEKPVEAEPAETTEAAKTTETAVVTETTEATEPVEDKASPEAEPTKAETSADVPAAEEPVTPTE